MLLPAIKPCLAFAILSADDAEVLQNALLPPLSRAAYKYTVHQDDIELLFDAVLQRQAQRKQGRTAPLSDAHQRSIDGLKRAGGTADDEMKLTLLEEHLTKVRRGGSGKVLAGVELGCAARSS
jgi:hypothetical protein